MQNQSSDNIQYYKTGGDNHAGPQGTRPQYKTGHSMQYKSASGQIYSIPPPQGVMVTQPSAVAPDTSNYINWMYPAIFVTLFCFWPTGLVAVLYATWARKAMKGGDFAGAASYSRKVKIFVIISLAMGILVIISIILLFVLARSSNYKRY
ncbi:proline-rich transmembrane protein 1-like [Saccostrea cucullata]|uniref:proline-rich transmembrane protein 1-like n=1 Tax=Saccostrea cuccullata TaxID=36930 RepID=UPI002ED0BD76